MKRKVMSKSNRIFYIVNTVLLMICLLLVAMPILNVVASSLSSPSAVIRGQVSFWPKGWNIDAYEEIFSNRSLLTGYKNSIIYTIVGTCVNIVLTIMAAYPLSVKDFIGRKVISALFIFVMIFTAPLIPTYLNVKNLGLLDSMWALILPGAISVYNMIIARTYFQNSIPEKCWNLQDWMDAMISGFWLIWYYRCQNLFWQYWYFIMPLLIGIPILMHLFICLQRINLHCR